MRIARSLLDEIVAHALEDAPDECCGVIGTRDGEAVRVHRVRNAAASPLRFEMDPMEQYRATMAIEDEGLELGAMYHSHTRSAPRPSQTDVNLATRWWPDPVWVIVGVGDPQAPEVRAYAIRDGAFEEVPLEVV
ncbi:MAG TPA: M67 family metallopeptidase [Solirubrobacteraceae bacterium]|nr:M67 family metallopeptidase [Solirubrobacteraceae bacterium]